MKSHLKKYKLLLIAAFLPVACSCTALKHLVPKNQGMLNNLQLGGERTSGVSMKRQIHTRQNNGTIHSGAQNNVTGKHATVYQREPLSESAMDYAFIVGALVGGMVLGCLVGWIFLKRPKDRITSS